MSEQRNDMHAVPGTVDVEETVESLEASGRQLYRVWMLQRLKRLAIGVAFALLAVLAVFFLRSCTDISKTFADGKRDLAKDIISAPRTFMDFLVMGVIVIALVIGVGMALTQTGKLMLGPPKAGKNPVKTVRQFYSGAIFVFGVIDSGIEIAAYVCLLNRAKIAIGEWSGFREYWTRINKAIVELLHVRSGQPVTKTQVALKDVRITNANETPDSVRYECDIDFSVVSGVDNPPFTSSKTYGPYTYCVKGELRRVGRRWYVCDGHWEEILASPTGKADPARPSSV